MKKKEQLRVQKKEIQEKERRVERKEKEKVSIFAHEVSNAFVAKQSLLVLVYKEAFLNSSELNSSFPSVVESLL